MLTESAVSTPRALTIGEERPIGAATGRSNLGVVEPTRTYNWDELSALLEEPVHSAVDHRTYLAYPKAKRDELKKKDRFVLFGTCRDGVRDDEHLVSRSAITLDFDKDAGNLFFDLDCGRTFGDFASLWHTTRSHSADAPRLRVIIPLARDVSPAEYRPLCAAVAALFNSALDPASIKPAQMMFLPVQNKGADFLHGKHPGHGYLNPDYYLAIAAANGNAPGPTVAPRARTPDLHVIGEVDPLMLKQPDPRWTLERVKAELVPWLRWLMIHTPEIFDRSTWLTKLLGGLHHQFRGSDEGRELAHNISSRDDRTCVDKGTGETVPMYDPDTLDREWSTLRADRKEGNVVSVGTLIKLAEDARAQAPVEDVVKWLARLPIERYEQIRKAEAERINVRVGPLDNAVKKARRTAGNADVDGSDGEDEDSSGFFEKVEPWPESVDGAMLLDELAATFRRFIVCSEATAQAAALWVVMTWLIDSVSVAPIAAITAPEKRCGKTQLLSVMSRICQRPISASNISPAALFRALEAWQPTLLLDEADAFMRENEELRGILNAGHTRDTAYVVRTVGEDHTPTRFDVFGAKAIAGIGHLSDTLMDRSIALELRRKLPSERVDKLRDADPELFGALCSKLARWSRDNAGAVRAARPVVPNELHDRAADNWFPLLQVAEIVGGSWPETAKRAALMLSGEFNESPSSGVELLGDIKAAFERLDASRVSMADLLTELLRDDDAPWRTWSRGRPMSVRQLGAKLAEFGIQAKPLRDGYKVSRGFVIGHFADAFARYLPSPPLTPVSPVTQTQANTGGGSSVTTAVFEGAPESDLVTLEPLPDKACDCVTGETGVTGVMEQTAGGSFLD
ncbi:DUF3631 domain-containing protein [Paraburkholderia silviterrae]|nr:DUF3631 domain-containing protein [Paraburkholderia silviterrae]